MIPYTLKLLAFIGMAGWVLSGCASTHLTATPTHIKVTSNDLTVDIPYRSQQINRDNYSTMYLTQALVRLESGEYAVYEKAVCDELYEFEPSSSQILRHVFETKYIYKYYAKDGLYLYQALLPTKEKLNILLHQANTQEFRILYGMRTHTARAIIRQLDKDAILKHLPNANALAYPPEVLPSKWNTTKIHFIPLVIPLRQFSGN